MIQIFCKYLKKFYKLFYKNNYLKFLYIQIFAYDLLINSNISVNIFYNHMNNYFRFLLIQMFMYFSYRFKYFYKYFKTFL